MISPFRAAEMQAYRYGCRARELLFTSAERWTDDEIQALLDAWNSFARQFAQHGWTECQVSWIIESYRDGLDGIEERVTRRSKGWKQ